MHKSVLAAGTLTQAERDFINTHHMVVRRVFSHFGIDKPGTYYRLVHSRSRNVLASATSKKQFKTDCAGFMSDAVFAVLFRKHQSR